MPIKHSDSACLVYPYHVAVQYIINEWCISLFVDFLLSNNHVNSIISHQFDFTDEEVSIGTCIFNRCDITCILQGRICRSINQSVYCILIWNLLHCTKLSIAKQQCSSCLCDMISILLAVYNFAIKCYFLFRSWHTTSHLWKHYLCV